MGNHYVPQKYLRGFAEPENPDAIWMYDKKLHKFTNPTIKSIAQESAFYSAEIEYQLNELVEKPANLVLDKLRCQEEINDQDRISQAIYIATMIKRVPKRRTKALAMYPAVYEKTMKEIRSEVEEWARVSQDKELVERRMAELEKAEQTYRNEPPKEILEQIRIPWPSQQMIALVYSMSWRIVQSKGPSFFLTSDNPAFIFDAYGLGKPESELTFPIATDLALFGSWVGQQNSIIYLQEKQRLIREANKRIASSAERFVFYHRKEEWIAKVSDNKKPYLSRIKW
jgi:hypothetical protein